MDFRKKKCEDGQRGIGGLDGLRVVIYLVLGSWCGIGYIKGRLVAACKVMLGSMAHIVRFRF